MRKASSPPGFLRLATARSATGPQAGALVEPKGRYLGHPRGASSGSVFEEPQYSPGWPVVGRAHDPRDSRTHISWRRRGRSRGEQPFEDSLVRPLDFYASNDIERQFGSLRLRVADTSGPAGQKPEEIVAGQHAYGNSVLDHGDVMQIPLHHAAYDGR
jgi:hypothetical protein